MGTKRIGLAYTDYLNKIAFDHVAEVVSSFADIIWLDLDFSGSFDHQLDLLMLHNEDKKHSISESLKRLKLKYQTLPPIVLVQNNQSASHTDFDLFNGEIQAILNSDLSLEDITEVFIDIASDQMIQSMTLKRQIEQMNLDISELKMNLDKCLQSENEINQTKRFYQELFERAPMGYQSLDEHGNFLEVNQKWTEIFGYTREEVLGKNFSSIIIPEYHDQYHDRFQTFKSRGKMNSEFKILSKDQEVLDIKFEGQIMHDDLSNQIKTLCILENATEMNKVKEAVRYNEERYQTLVNQMPLGLAVYEALLDDAGKPYDYRTVSLNRSYERITGIKPNDRVNKTLREVFPPDICDMLQAYEASVLNGNSVKFEFYFPNIKKYLDVSAYYTSDKQLAVVIADATERVELNHKLILEKQRLSRVVQSTADIIFEIGMDKRFISVYGKGLKKIHHVSSDYQGKTVIEVFGKDGKERDLAYTQALHGHNVSYQWNYLTSGQTLYFESTIAPIYDEENRIVGAVGIARDITEQKKVQDEIEFMSKHDYLTELYNRRYFEQKLKAMNTSDHYPMGIMILDLNGLKIYNDAYGHEIGDQALLNVSKVLKRMLKNQEVIARIGGDEFAVLFPRTTTEALYEIKHRLIDEVSKLRTGNIEMSIAIGYDLLTSQKTNITEVQKNAENYMYRHKLADGMSTRNHAIQAILQTLTDKYEEEKIHSQRVSTFCVALGRALDLNQDSLKELELSGLYHDIGKISIPDAILDKPGKLTNEEYDIIKTHTEVGYNILRAADAYSNLAENALYHHERWDGKGYPRGLAGLEIPLFSRVINVCDSFEAMTANRPYKKKMTTEEAGKEIMRCSGTQFDPTLAKLFVSKVLNLKI